MKALAALGIVFLLAAPAAAQESFKQVWVTQADSGEVVRGRLVELSAASLAVLTPDNRRVEIPVDRVLRIEGRGDSVKNGALIGAAVMAGLSLFGCQGTTSAGQCSAFVLANVGVGALMGVGVDALIPGRSTLYSKPATPGRGAGLQLKLRF
jgi:hypothetical protein